MQTIEFMPVVYYFTNAPSTLAAPQVTITEPGVVIGATILINSLGANIAQAFVVTIAGHKLVRMPIRPIYVGGQVWKMIQTDFSNPYGAFVNRGTYSPWLNRFLLLRQIPPFALASQIIYSFWPRPPIQQFYLATQRPNPIGPSNANLSYSMVLMLVTLSSQMSSIAPMRQPP